MKRVILLSVLTLFLSIAYGQDETTGGLYNNNLRVSGTDETVSNPDIPIEDGMLILLGAAAFYIIRRKQKVAR